MNGKKIGILGGTFNPIHNGHIELAIAAKKECHLDRVIVLPSGISYRKNDVLDGGIRLEMAKLACEAYEFMQVSDLEVTRSGNTYTIDTIRILKEQFPNDSFYFIMGEDSLYSLESWKDASQLFSLITIVVAHREASEVQESRRRSLKEQVAYLIETFHATIEVLQMPPMLVSSSEIRMLIQNNRVCTSYLDEAVLTYIDRNNLYREL